MQQQDYQCTFDTKTSPEVTFDRINRVSEWWATDVRGNSNKLNDEFSVHFGKTFSKFKIIEMIPEKKVVWYVVDCYLHGFKDEAEWKGTQVIFEISKVGDNTRVHMTHVGLHPEVHCYENCREGWNYYAGKSLQDLVSTGKGTPNIPKVPA